MLLCVFVVLLFFVVLFLVGFVLVLELQFLFLGEDVVGQVQVIKVKYEDIFVDFGEQYNLGYSEMVVVNFGVDFWLLGVGIEVIIFICFVLLFGLCEGVVINLVEYCLYYYLKGQNVVYIYLLGIGCEGWGLLIVNICIIVKIKDLVWYLLVLICVEYVVDGDLLLIVVLLGLDNLLGLYKLILGVLGYLIYGLNKKFGIGICISYGCFCMYNVDVIYLFLMISVGISVCIINEFYKFGVSNGKVYLEVYMLLNDYGDLLVVDKYIVVINILFKCDDLVKCIQLNWDVVCEVVVLEDGVLVEIVQELVLVMIVMVDSDFIQFMF